jgi:hypothetical protein
LGPFLTAFDDFGIDFYGIPGAEQGDAVFELISVQDIDDVHKLSSVEAGA